MLVKTVLQFKRIDSTIASSALKELQLHFWYLIKKMLPLCLFDGCVAYEEKEKKLLKPCFKKKRASCCSPQKEKKGKPKFPEEVNEDSLLVDSTGEDTWTFFGY